VNDQIGQPTSTIDLANQIINLLEANSPPGVYHGTNSGETTWFKFAQKIFELTDSEINRVVPVSSDKYPSEVVRPSYSVLSHNGWNKCSIPAMRDWESALIEAIPKIIETVAGELK
jgi:dTDP-4-dehydrorhamnose reductase